MTSGASDTIFKNFFSRNSRATGPKTRVPTGSPASLIKTAAFWSKRIYVPSRLRCSLRVRTITAFTTLPFCTCPSGAASFTAAVIMSPRPAFSPVEPPSGRIICSLRAPELSATSSMLLIITAIASISQLTLAILSETLVVSFSHPERGLFISLCHPERRSLPRRISGCSNPSPRRARPIASLLNVLLQHDLRHQRRLAHNVLQLPALQFRERTRLFQPHHIAHMCLILLVVRVKLLVARHHAPIERMRLLARHLHHDGLGHLVRDHFSHHFLAPALHLRARRRCGLLRCGFRHQRFPVAAERVRSPRIVFTRAMSLRSPRIFFRLSVCPMFS